MPQLVETEEIPLETLSFKSLSEGILLPWDYVKTQMSEAFLNTIIIRGFTELRR